MDCFIFRICHDDRGLFILRFSYLLTILYIQSIFLSYNFRTCLDTKNSIKIFYLLFLLCDEEANCSESEIIKATFKYDLIYSIYSFPNILLPLFGGYIVDRIGVRKAMFFYSCFVTAGQAIVFLSGPITGADNYNTMTSYRNFHTF